MSNQDRKEESEDHCRRVRGAEQLLRSHDEHQIQKREQVRLRLRPGPGQLHICQMAGQRQRDEEK
eukprot:5811332-Heterocapsa_arctica.AAC.1